MPEFELVVSKTIAITPSSASHSCRVARFKSASCLSVPLLTTGAPVNLGSISRGELSTTALTSWYVCPCSPRKSTIFPSQWITRNWGLFFLNSFRISSNFFDRATFLCLLMVAGLATISAMSPPEALMVLVTIARWAVDDKQKWVAAAVEVVWRPLWLTPVCKLKVSG